MKIAKFLNKVLLLTGGMAVAVNSMAGITTRIDLGVDNTQGIHFGGMSSSGEILALTTHLPILPGNNNGKTHIYVQNKLTGERKRVTVSTDGALANSHSSYPSLSSDGRYVVFNSDADNLVSDDTNGLRDIFIHDVETKETIRIPPPFQPADLADVLLHSVPSYTISGNGRYIVYDTPHLGYRNIDGRITNEVYLYDRVEGETTRVSTPIDQASESTFSNRPSISNDGRYIVFSGDSRYLKSENYRGAVLSAFIYDQNSGKTTAITENVNTYQKIGFPTGAATISGDGRHIAFTSRLSGDNQNNVYVLDRDTDAVSKISVSSTGEQTNSHVTSDPQLLKFSDNGRFVAYWSLATNLVSDDTNGVRDIFVRDIVLEETTRVSVASDGTQGNNESTLYALSDDGRYIFFGSFANNLVPDDKTSTADYFIHDRGPITATLSITASIDAQPTLTEPGPPLPDSGSPATWKYTVKNHGSEPAMNVRVFAKALQPVTDQKFTFLCGLGEIAGGASVSCNSESLVVNGNFKAIISTQGFDKNGGRIKAGAAAYYIGGFDAVTFSLELDVLLNGADNDNIAPGDVLTVGETVNFIYNVTNTGTVALTNVRVFDRTRTGNGFWRRACVFASVAAGETVRCTREMPAESGNIQRQVSVQSSYLSNVIKDGEFSYYTGQ